MLTSIHFLGSSSFAALCDALATTTPSTNASDIENRKIRSFCDPVVFPHTNFSQKLENQRATLDALTQKSLGAYQPAREHVNRCTFC